MPLLPAHLFVGIIADFTRQTSIDDDLNPASNSGIKTSQGWPVYDYESGFALFIPPFAKGDERGIYLSHPQPGKIPLTLPLSKGEVFCRLSFGNVAPTW